VAWALLLDSTTRTASGGEIDMALAPLRRRSIGKRFTPIRRGDGLEDSLLRAMFEASATGIALVGRDGRPLRCNPALEQMLGYSESELSRMTFAEFTHRDDREQDLKLFRELLDGERSSYRIDKRYMRKDGTVLVGRLTVSLARGAGDLLIGMVEDITEMQASEERLRLALAVAQMGVWEWDLISNRVTWSAQLAAFVGHAGELSGAFSEFTGYVHPDDREQLMSELHGAINEPHVPIGKPMEFRLQRSDGTFRRVSAIGDRQWVNGRMLRMIAVILECGGATSSTGAQRSDLYSAYLLPYLTAGSNGTYTVWYTLAAGWRMATS